MGERSIPPAYFVDLYRRKRDPWNFENSAYEREKYATSLRVLRDWYPCACEIGCSIGVFTAKLAPRCGRLVALDPSPDALARAARRVPPNVDLRLGVVPADFPRERFDLVTFCEVGFYLDAADLEATKERIIDALRPAGDVLLVHWTPPVRGHAVSAQFVHASFADDARLLRRAHVEHETYVLDLLTVGAGGRQAEPEAGAGGDRSADRQR